MSHVTSTLVKQSQQALTVEQGGRRVLGGNGAVLLITVVSTVVELITHQRAEVQAAAIGAQELALCGRKKTKKTSMVKCLHENSIQ